jgi:hypothetical protein
VVFNELKNFSNVKPFEFGDNFFLIKHSFFIKEESCLDGGYYGEYSAQGQYLMRIEGREKHPRDVTRT